MAVTVHHSTVSLHNCFQISCVIYKTEGNEERNPTTLQPGKITYMNAMFWEFLHMSKVDPIWRFFFLFFLRLLASGNQANSRVYREHERAFMRTLAKSGEVWRTLANPQHHIHENLPDIHQSSGEGPPPSPEFR